MTMHFTEKKGPRLAVFHSFPGAEARQHLEVPVAFLEMKEEIGQHGLPGFADPNAPEATLLLQNHHTG